MSWRQTVSRLSDRRAMALGDQLVVSGSNFISMLLAGRFMQPADFGSFILAYTLCLFFANVHRALITQPLNVLGAGEASERLGSRMSGLLLLHGALLPAGGLLIAIGGVFFFSDSDLCLAAIAYIFAYSLQDLFRRWCYTRGEPDRALFNDVISYVGQVLLLIMLGWQGSLTGVSAFYAMASTSALAVVFGLPKVSWGRPQWPELVRVGREHARFGGWLLATVLATWSASQLYPFLVAELGAASVAVFAACRNIANGVGVLVQTVNNYLPSRMRLVLKEKGAGAFATLYRRVLFSVALAALIGCSAMAFWAEAILGIVYGETYRSAAVILQILSLGTFFTALGAVLGSKALALQDSRSSFISNIVAALFTFTVGFFAVSRWGVAGAAVAASGSVLIAVMVQALLLARTRSKSA